jgi:quercetin dioxygenase-like cupin family protein
MSSMNGEQVMAMATPVPIVRGAGEGDKQSFSGGGLHTWKLLTEDTGGAFFLFEDVMTRGKVTPLHLHPEGDELVYVLEGEILSIIDGEEHEVAAGGMTFTPHGVPHAFMVVSETARLLTLQTPGTGQAFYRGASEPATDDEASRVDLDRLRASAVENGGIEILGPPPFQPLEVG